MEFAKQNDLNPDSLSRAGAGCDRIAKMNGVGSNGGSYPFVDFQVDFRPLERGRRPERLGGARAFKPSRRAVVARQGRQRLPVWVITGNHEALRPARFTPKADILRRGLHVRSVAQAYMSRSGCDVRYVPKSGHSMGGRRMTGSPV